MGRDITRRLARLEEGRDRRHTPLPVDHYSVWSDDEQIAAIVGYYRAHVTPDEAAHEAEVLDGHSETIAAGRWWMLAHDAWQLAFWHARQPAAPVPRLTEGNKVAGWALTWPCCDSPADWHAIWCPDAWGRSGVQVWELDPNKPADASPDPAVLRAWAR